MITLSAADSQIVLYAKGHFGYDRTNQLEDLRILVAKRAWMPPGSITDRDIVAVLTMILDELNLKMNGKFIESVVFGEFWQKDKTSPCPKLHLRRSVTDSGMPVKDCKLATLVEIQELDPNALSVPVSDENPLTIIVPE